MLKLFYFGNVKPTLHSHHNQKEVMKETLHNNLKEHRLAQGLSQQDLAQDVGVSRQSIISIERNKYVPSLPLALRLAWFFDCSVEDLFRLEETKPKDR